MTSAVARIVQYCELELDDACSLTYGTSPCTATLTGETPTGAFKCFNTDKTCQDIANLAAVNKTLRFAVPAPWLDPAIEAVHSIRSIEIEPGEVSLGGDLGLRTTARIEFDDHPWPDPGDDYDKYPESRNYDPIAQGTYWGKFRARHPYVRDRTVNLYHGEAGEALGAMEKRVFVGESIDGPLPAGTFVLIAEDPLKLADGDRALAPALSPGFIQSAINDTDTSVTVSPSGAGSSYPSSDFYVALGAGEIVHVSSRSSDVLTIDARAAFNTEATSHASGDRVQLCLYYSAEDPADIIEDLLTTYASVPSAYVPISDWQTETATYYNRVLTRLIAEPTPVNDLVSSVIETAGLALWWSDVDQEIGLQVLRSVSTGADLFDESNILTDTLEVRDQPEKRVSRVQVFFNQQNPLKPVDDPDNYTSVEEVSDTDAEANYGSQAIRQVYSPWIPSAGRSSATRLGDLLLSRYVDPPRRIAFEVLRPQADNLSLAGGYRLAGWPFQDAQGASSPASIQVTRLRPGAAGIRVEAEEVLFTAGPDLEQGVLTFDISQNDIDLFNEFQSVYGNPNHGDTVTATVTTGVVIGATSTAAPAFSVEGFTTLSATGDTTSSSAVITNLSEDTGDLAAGMVVAGTGIPDGAKILSVDSSSQITLDQNATATGTGVSLTIYTTLITLTVNGRIQGPGGEGGQGGNNSFAIPPTAGSPGGVALFVDYPVTLVSTDGEVWGGGGGGGGGDRGPSTSGHGGGGGAGTVAGDGGPAGGSGATDGDPGTATAGGHAGDPFFPEGAGDGGDPGDAGATGTDFPGFFSPGAGGAAGAAIDGDSWVTDSGAAGDIQGSRIN